MGAPNGAVLEVGLGAAAWWQDSGVSLCPSLHPALLLIREYPGFPGRSVVNIMSNKLFMCTPGLKWWLGVLLASLFLLFSASTRAACTASSGMRDDVLIVVNANAADSAQVGDYYCEQRGINPANVAQVFMPAIKDVPLEQFISLRDQLIRFLQQNTFTSSEPVVVCDTTQGYTKYYCPQSVDQIRRLTRIRYLVMTRGMPIRFTFTGSTVNKPDITSIDNYLRYWLLNYYVRDIDFEKNQRWIDFLDGRGMRIVNPSIDKEFIIGRIDGITPVSAMQLVDRAIAAERNGIYGKLVSSRYGASAGAVNTNGAYWKQWIWNGSPFAVYPSEDYLHGLFGQYQSPSATAVTHVTNPACKPNDPNITVPQDCVVRYATGGVSKSPGSSLGVVPKPDRTLVFHGYGAGFSSQVDFNSVLNWRDSDTCNTLCDPADAACKAASTDTYKEIDTRCVRVAEGFMGYNFGSFPVGLMSGSPTGWYVNVGSGATQWLSNTSGSTSYRAPRIRDDLGFDDNYSLWFDGAELLFGAHCYSAGDDLQLPPSSSCVNTSKFLIDQMIPLAEQTLDTVAPQVVTVRFKFRALNLNQGFPLQVRLFVHESAYSDASVTILTKDQIDYAKQDAITLTSPNTPSDATSWGDAIASFTLDPALHRHPQYLFDAIKIRIESKAAFEGQLAIDDVSVDIDGVNVPVQNASFNDGHRQLSGGDSAATFLGRLNGTAFWGNLSHHGVSAGRSFDTHIHETLIYFLRGLPLGDAVWFAERWNSGIFYGDPLYSPIAVHLHYLSNSIPGAPKDTFERRVPLVLQGDTVNGTGSDVTTTYSMSYCGGKDFLVCDQGQTWVPIANLQNLPGGRRDMPLGSWDGTQLAEGDYTLRLAVTSSNATSGMSQTFNDYYPLSLQDDLVTPVNLSGTIKTAAGTPLCALVLASGKSMFSCNPIGDFALSNLPRAADGRVKVQVFADGYRPYVVYVVQSGVHDVVLTPAGICPNYNQPYTPAVNTGLAGQRVDISGQVLDGQNLQPVCAIVLAGGKSVFSCGGAGSYAMNIPLNANGQFKLQVFAQGFAPYTVVLDPLRLVNTVKLAKTSECQ